MDLNHYNFTINPVGLVGGARAKYVSDVHEHLKWIHRTKSGRLLLNVIRKPAPALPIEIRPHAAECNATGGNEVHAPTGALRGFATYSPGNHGHGGACRALPAAQRRGTIGDEMLFHELVHVFRATTGKWTRARGLGLNMMQYTDNEEFLAVMCTNIYISDRTNKYKSGLRAGHVGFAAMDPNDAKRFALFANSRAAYGLVKGFCDDNPLFSKALSDQLGDVEYNPVADYYRYPKVCEALSFLGGLRDRMKGQAIFQGLGMTSAQVDALLTAMGV